ncbi:hypothetical protein HPC49_36850 [Pyxidicoccus fallax]|uniref:Uncharacterized protein n=1 Tax=Pyxidicoccus fallax TaxID=394095 RepID=A0A848LRI9_9BACT|nr:hypothetical protein [Pyxidicoccus fallax]NMO20376.1 hypothetical protein [Pyxidicoccus fallax]NPC83776.1 hypothetical protein [Pyxidicoccus fallax]
MYIFDESLWPLVLIQRVDSTTDEEMDSILRTLTRLINRREPYVQVIDFTRARPLTHSQRMKLAEHQEQNAAVAREYCKGFHVVINSATARLARAVTSFVRPSLDQPEEFSSLADALEKAAVRFEQAGVPKGALVARNQLRRLKAPQAPSGAGSAHG